MSHLPSEESVENDGCGSDSLSESSDAPDESDIEDESTADEDSSEDSSDEPDSDDSVWEEIGGTSEETQEANEALAMQEFQQALTYLVDDRRDRAVKIFHRLLKHPLITPFHKVDVDWEEETDHRLSKMARLFVGIHKNLAKLEEENAVHHYIQVLATAPHNSSVWLDLGLKCVEHGDLELSLYAFRRVDSVDCGEHIASVLYLSKQYHACLQHIKRLSDGKNLSEKLLFLRERIRDMGSPYRELCEEVFSENPKYDPVIKYRKRSWKDLENRLIRAEDIQRSKEKELSDSPAVLKTIDLEIESDYDFLHIATIFCDVFDRIESYSVLSSQEVRFTSWEDRSAVIDISDLVKELVDVVEITEDMIGQAARNADFSAKWELLRCRSASSRSRSCSLLGDTNRKTIRRSTRLPIREDENTASNNNIERMTRESSADSDSLLSGSGCYNKLASFIGCHRQNVIPPLRDGMRRPSRTPTPFFVCKQLDEELIISRLRSTCISKPWRIREIIEATLLEVSCWCPQYGSLPAHLHQVTRQLYMRLNMMRSNMGSEEWLHLHVLMDELGESNARDYSIRWHLSHPWPTRELGLRFAWNHAKLITDDNIRLDFLYVLEDSLDDDEVIFTATESFCKAEVEVFIEKLEKKERIRSIKEHRANGSHDMIDDIMERDIDLSSVEEDELITMIGYWIDALCALKNCDKAIGLLNRLMSHRLLTSSLDDESLIIIIDWIDLILKLAADYDSSGRDISAAKWETAAFLLCQISSLQPFSSNHRLWITLYRIIKYIDGPATVESLSHWLRPSSTEHQRENGMETDDDSSDDGEMDHDEDKMPTRALDVLSKAHEALGEAKTCSAKQSDFLSIYLGELSHLFTTEGIRQLISQKEPAWLWSNVQQEVSQALYCAFGKYCKKKKNMDEHDCSSDLHPTRELAELVIPLAMPIIMPLFDDKERLGHDVVELIQSRFPFLLEVGENRRDQEQSVTHWLKVVDKQRIEVCQWPSAAGESSMLASVWYVMALHSYRQNLHTETMCFSRLFLSSGQATRQNRITVSAWAMLAHSSVCTLFQLQEDDMLREYQWRIMPFRVGLSVCNSLAILHFQLANALYQIATKLSRFIYQLPSDDIRRRGLPSIGQMREESHSHFEAALSLAQPTPSSPIEDFQWLCYFFLAKLQSKSSHCDIVKVVDYLFEAACSLELGDFFYYTIKISAKKQQNIEPVELHYQAHSSIWKYISRTDDPPVDTLMKLLSYVKAFQSHKVVRNNYSLFTHHPELHESLIRMTAEVAGKEADSTVEVERIDEDVEVIENGYSLRKDLLDELFSLCYKAFELVCDRFPHPKAHYRLAEMELSRGKTNKAGEHLLRGIFKRKKKDDGFLDGLIEITSTDIDRCGSLAFHVERSLRLALRVLSLQGDLATLLHAVTAIVNVVGQGDEDHLRVRSYRALLSLSLRALRPFITDANTLKQSRADVYRLWTALSKYDSCMDLRGFRHSLVECLRPVIPDMDIFVRQQQVEAEVKKRQIRKRKMTSFDLARSQPSPPVAPEPEATRPPPPPPLPQLDPDIQIMEDPLVLMRIAMQAAGYGNIM